MTATLTRPPSTGVFHVNGRTVTVSAEHVTPELAARFLERRADEGELKQRSVRPRKRYQYGRDALGGRWQFNGELFKFVTDADGDEWFVDGQHRAEGLVEAGKLRRVILGRWDAALAADDWNHDADGPAHVISQMAEDHGVDPDFIRHVIEHRRDTFGILVLVVRGLDPDAVPTMDKGIARTYGDVLRMRGVGDSTVVSTVVRHLVLWYAGFPTGRTTGHMISLSDPELEAFRSYHEDAVRVAVAKGRDIRQHSGNLLTSRLGATAFYLTAEQDYDSAVQFWDRFMTGANLPSTSPILALRERLLRTAITDRLKPEERLALCIRAWNLWGEDTPTTTLIIARGGLTNENFPKPRKPKSLRKSRAGIDGTEG